MRDKVFLNNDRYDYSEREFTSIDSQMGDIAAGLRSIRKAEKDPMRTEDIGRHFRALRAAQSSERDRDPEYDESAELDNILASVSEGRTRKTLATGKKAKREVPESFKAHQFKPKGADDDCDEEDGDDCAAEDNAPLKKKAQAAWGKNDGVSDQYGDGGFGDDEGGFGDDEEFGDDDFGSEGGSGFGAPSARGNGGGSGSNGFGGDSFGGGDDFGGDDSFGDDLGDEDLGGSGSGSGSGSGGRGFDGGLNSRGNFDDYAGQYLGPDDDEGLGDYDHEFGDMGGDSDMVGGRGRAPRQPAFASSRKPQRRAKKRVIEFTSEDQLNSDALKAARQAGDKALYKTILAARDLRRDHWQRRIEASVEAEEKKIALAKTASADKKSVRLTIAKKAEASVQNAQRIAKASAAKPEVKVAFKKPSDMDSRERTAMMQFAVRQGLPEKAVLAMFAETTPEITNEESQIREILSSDLAMPIKKAACEALTRTAKLDGNQVDRLKRFWTEELGYADEGASEWVSDWLNSKYDTKGNGNDKGEDSAE